MEKHFIYIITDSNRAYLEVGYCTDMNLRLSEITTASSALFGSSPKLSNVVYLEEFSSREHAATRQQQLQYFTRMQREKLIRLKNPNWLNLHSTSNNMENKKFVVYA